MDYGLMACRAVHFTASLTVFGVLVFQHMLAPRTLAAALADPLKRLTVACVVIAAITSLIWLILLTAMTGEGWRSVSAGGVGTVLFGMQFGAVWQWHMGLLIGLAVLMRNNGRLPGQFIVFAAGLYVATLGLVGHAVIRSGAAGVANRAALVLHVLAAGFWLGSLIPVVLCLRIPTAGALQRDAMTALRRFSTVGHASVALVVLTGLINIPLIQDRVTLDLATPYRQLLAAKIAVVAVMIGLAVTNRYWLVPRLGQDAAAIDHIRRICITVYCLGLGAIGLVSVFGTLAPT